MTRVESRQSGTAERKGSVRPRVVESVRKCRISGSVLLMALWWCSAWNGVSALPSKVHALAGSDRPRAHSTDRSGAMPAARLTIQRGVRASCCEARRGSLKTYRVMVDSEVGRVDVPLALAVQSE